MPAALCDDPALVARRDLGHVLAEIYQGWLAGSPKVSGQLLSDTSTDAVSLVPATTKRLGDLFDNGTATRFAEGKRQGILKALGETMGQALTRMLNARTAERSGAR